MGKVREFWRTRRTAAERWRAIGPSVARGPRSPQADLAMVVAAAPETQLRRVMNRDKVDDAAAQKRIAAQMPLALKLDRCDVALQNDTSKVALHALLEAGVLPRLRKRARRRYFVSLPGFVFVVVLIYTFSYLARRDRLF